MITGILLAAGRGERFGGDKLLATLPDGRCVAETAAASLVAALPRVMAVLRPGNDALAERLVGAGCEVIQCDRADEGMGTSLACGVASVPEAEGWVVALADMPWIRAATVARVAAALADGAPMAAPAYRGRRGHPVGFAHGFGRDLRALRGDEGARALVEDDPDRLVLLDVDDPGVLRDIDTRDDLDPDAVTTDS